MFVGLNPLIGNIALQFVMESVDDYARQWSKRDIRYVDSLTEWEESLRSLMQIRITKLNRSKGTRTK